MVTFPEFKGSVETFDKPVYVNLKYLEDENPVTWFKITGYDNNGQLVGTVVNIDDKEGWFSIHNLEYQFQNFDENKFHTYSEIDEEEYSKAFNRVIEKLK